MSTQWIGSDLRSSASSATGRAARLTSGSRKSNSAGMWEVTVGSPQLQRVLVPVKHGYIADQRRGRIAACQTNGTCSSLAEWVTLSSSKPPAARLGSAMVGSLVYIQPSFWEP